ncbi:MAG: response regulator transcription factor [Burkholderiaceae bacterium]|nr:response regulator transcription factor [Rhodoferax sp.]MCP5283658.1 response regulator transcription factor [Burkholderiaceae bacterium]
MTLALIADDEPALARHLQRELAALWPDLQFTPLARHGVEAAELIAAHRPDVAFLDIQMPGLTGLEVAQGIEGATRVVFVTAYDEYAVQAFEQQALDYLLKPAKADRLLRCVQRLQLAQQATAVPELADDRLAQVLRQLLPAAEGTAPAAPAQRLRWVRASAGELMHQIPVEEVLFFQADDKYTVVQTATAEHLIRTPIVELLPLLDPEVFVQVHRSTVVNLAHLTGTRRDEASRLYLRLRDFSRELPVSRAYVHLFKAM